MRRALLDINVLLALLDGDHVDHMRAHQWLDVDMSAGWASCAITENGFVRIISQPRYPSPSLPPRPSSSSPGRPPAVITSSGPVRSACSIRGSSTGRVCTVPVR